MGLEGLRKALGEDWKGSGLDWVRADGVALQWYDSGYCWDVYIQASGRVLPKHDYYKADSVEEARALCDQLYPYGSDQEEWFEYPEYFDES